MQTIELRELEKLKTLRLNIGRSLSQGEGMRRSSAKGRSAEFSGYREYIPGDDMRYVDWNAFARFDKLFIKEFMEEKEGRVNIFLDTSLSMEFGQKLKSTLMAELTEAISYIATSGKDMVYVTDLCDIKRSIRVANGNLGVSQLKKWLTTTNIQGRVNLIQSLKKSIKGRGGIAFLISDLMDEEFLDNEDEIIRLFEYHNMKLIILHVLSKEELNIEDVGAFQLVDAEDQSRDIKLTLDRNTVGEYQRALEDYIRKVKEKAKAGGMGYVLCSTGDPLQEILFIKLREIYSI
ncbi:MAG: DUF58 domain-containing protein [Eubacterium sp.]|nr:DUF58 domain-containing protein [Eubacterium sp.]